MERLHCKNCGSLILSTTYQKNNGICLLCARGITKVPCNLCHKESTVLTNIDGKKVCLTCSRKLSIPLSDRWKNACSPENNIFDIENLKIKPYPEFEDVFFNNTLKGFYFPLCSIILKNKKKDNNQIFHIVSHNGLWLNENSKNSRVNTNYSVFKLTDNKYTFSGDTADFKGSNYIKDLYTFLELSFESISKNKLTLKEFLNYTLEKYPFDLRSFDYKHYIETFFYYQSQKIKFKNEIKENNFMPFRDLKNLNLFTGYDNNDFINIGEEIILNEKYFENQAQLIEKVPLGACWADRYFHDGNTIFAFFDEENELVYCVNQYS